MVIKARKRTVYSQMLETTLVQTAIMITKTINSMAPHAIALDVLNDIF